MILPAGRRAAFGYVFKVQRQIRAVKAVAAVGADDLTLPLDHGGATPVAGIFHCDASPSPDAGGMLIMDALL
jgi:hypothetical protein